MDQLCPVCKEMELIAIGLKVGSHDMLFVSCAACGTRWWHQNGVEVKVDEVVSLTAGIAQLKGPSKQGRRGNSTAVLERHG